MIYGNYSLKRFENRVKSNDPLFFGMQLTRLQKSRSITPPSGIISARVMVNIKHGIKSKPETIFDQRPAPHNTDSIPKYIRFRENRNIPSVVRLVLAPGFNGLMEVWSRRNSRTVKVKDNGA